MLLKNIGSYLSSYLSVRDACDECEFSVEHGHPIANLHTDFGGKKVIRGERISDEIDEKACVRVNKE